MKTLFALILFILSFTQAGTAATIVLVADAWPPFNNAANEKDKGYIVDIAETVFNRHGHKVEYRVMPWKIAVELTRKGVYDGLVGADSVDGAGLIFPEEAVGNYQIAFFVKEDNPWRFTNTRSLGKIVLGVAADYGYNEWLNDYIQANKKDYKRVQAATGEYPIETNIKKLLAGKIDATIASTSAMYYAAQKLGVADQIKFAGNGSIAGGLYIVFSPAKEKSSDYARMLDEGVRQLRKSGELAMILERYGLSDWE